MGTVLIEGRRLGTKSTAEPFNDDSEAEWARNAVRGSALLRHAVLTAMGIDPGPMLPAKPVPRVRDYIIVERTEQPIKRIQRVVASFYKIPKREMQSNRRAIKVSHPRQVAMYLSRELTPMSLPNIGKHFGNRDHTTVMWAMKAVEKRIATDPAFAADIATLRGELG